ncbi:MAG: sulfotransferase domain-containing protein [Planctomycetaceae bacterium]|nr:sulfotransferase domain-containing protein [Planctomycetaceae bacterium]
MDLTYASRYLIHDLFRMSVFWHRHAYGHIVTGQQSGSHWINNLLAHVVSAEFKIPPLRHIDDRLIIGHPRVPQPYPHIPQLIWTHHAPSPLVHAGPMRRLFEFPKYVLLLRDIRASLVGQYEKHRQDTTLTFSEYLRDHRVFGRQFKWDLDKRIVFFNAWGRVGERLPGQVCTVHYENMRRDTAGELERFWRFLELPITDPGVFQQAAVACSKEEMSRQEPRVRTHNLVRQDERDPVEWFSDDDRAYFSTRCDRLLKHRFGYSFDDWTSAKQPPQAAVARAA